MSRIVGFLLAFGVFAAARSAFSAAGQVLVLVSVPLIIVTLFNFTPVILWLTPIFVASVVLVAELGKSVFNLWPALRLSLYAFLPAFFFTVVLRDFPVDTEGHALLVAGTAFALTLLSEFTIIMIKYRSDQVERSRRDATAAQEVTSGSVQDFEESSESAAKLDARLDYRYRLARKEAEEEVRQFLPTNPRTAKRMVNHVSLAMAIAEERRLFEDPQITQQHLAKWIGISEQWPELGAVLTTSPDHMYRLEEASDVAELQRILDDLAPGTLASEDMLRRLSDERSLGGILPRLVRYEPH
jgi:hypothetical protein